MSPPAHNTARAPESGATDTYAEQADLDDLGTELSALGGKTVLVTGEGRRPCLHVVNPLAPTICARIYAQADFFWWPPTYAIGPRTAIPATAGHIARALFIAPAHTPEWNPAA